MDRIPDPKSFKQLTISVEKLPASTAQREAISSYAADRARLLLGCYRTGEANDPETYVAAISAILSRYPEEVITEVTHPDRGLPVRINWLPTLKDVKDACEVEERPMREHRARIRLEQEILAEREVVDVDRLGRLSYDELKAKYGPDWGLTAHHVAKAPPKPAPTVDQLRQHYVHYDLAMKPKQEPDHD